MGETYRIEASNRANAELNLTTMVVVWILAVLAVWWMRAGYGVRFVFDVHSRNFNPVIFMPILFAALGAFWGARGLLDAFRVWRFGTTVLEAELPFLGGSLKGTIRTDRELSPTGDYTIRLRCIETVQTGSLAARNVRYVDEPRWEGGRIVARGTVRSTTGIPFEIEIPKGVGALPSRPGSELRTAEGVRWVLEIFAPLRGLNYYALFLVIVREPEMTGREGEELEDETSLAEIGPTARGSALSRWLPGVVGALLTLLGIVALQDSIRFSLSAVPATGRIVDFHKARARSASTDGHIDVALPGKPPRRTRLRDTYGRIEWRPSGLVPLRCSRVERDYPDCRIISWAELWLQPIAFFAIGSAILGYAIARAYGPSLFGKLSAAASAASVGLGVVGYLLPAGPPPPVDPAALAVPMVPVPAGEFLMGCNAAIDSECEDDEKPGRRVDVAAFSIDKTEVTVAQYSECVKAGACGADGLEIPFYDGVAQREFESYCNWQGGLDKPINCVDWNQAQAFCKWFGKRLPTEREWEKAARGTDGRKYPWGNSRYDAAAKLANVAGDDGTAPVGSFPAGASPYGALDMAGNVFEWTSSGQAGRYVVRGGSWSNSPKECRASYRDGAAATQRTPALGFRCAR